VNPGVFRQVVSWGVDRLTAKRREKQWLEEENALRQKLADDREVWKAEGRQVRKELADINEKRLDALFGIARATFSERASLVAQHRQHRVDLEDRISAVSDRIEQEAAQARAIAHGNRRRDRQRRDGRDFHERDR